MLTKAAQALRASKTVLLRGPDYFRELVTRQVAGASAVQNTRRLLIYAHYSRLNQIEPHVVTALRAWHGLGTPIVFVTTNATLPEAEVARVLPFIRTAILRKNEGYDFGSYKTGLALTEDVEEFDRVILLNSSVFGPVRPLAPFLEKAEACSFDLTGATDTYWPEYHAQSYFLCMRRRFVASNFFKHYWRYLPLVSDRSIVIGLSELGLSRQAMRAGFKVGAVHDCWDLMAREMRSQLLAHLRKPWLREVLRRKCNTAMFFWPTLLRDLDFPFVKVELIRDNPFKDLAWAMWPEIVGAQGSEWVSLIKDHLKQGR